MTGSDLLRRLRKVGCVNGPPEGLTRARRMRQVHHNRPGSCREGFAAGHATRHRARPRALSREGVAEVKSYRVVYERDESGHWIVTVPSVRGCHSYGRSIKEARTRIREALGLFVRGAGKARLVDDIRLPAGTRRLLARQRGARQRAELEQARARAIVSKAVAALTEELGLSVRDAGELLGLSHQRVQQLSEAAEARM